MSEKTICSDVADRLLTRLKEIATCSKKISVKEDKMINLFESMQLLYEFKNGYVHNGKLNQFRFNDKSTWLKYQYAKHKFVIIKPE